MNILCPECGGNKVIDLGNNMYECRYCNKKFHANAMTQSSKVDNTVEQPQPVYTQQPQPVYTQQPQPVYTQQPQPVYTQQPQPVYAKQPSQLNTQSGTSTAENAPGCLMLGISFFIPIVGIILFFAKRKKEPVYAKICLQYAVISIILSFVLGIIMRVLLTYYVLQ